MPKAGEEKKKWLDNIVGAGLGFQFALQLNNAALNLYTNATIPCPHDLIIGGNLNSLLFSLAESSNTKSGSSAEDRKLNIDIFSRKLLLLIIEI